jgi:hypothetical protein
MLSAKKKKITEILILLCLVLFTQGCGKNPTDALLDEMEAISNQKSKLEAKLRSNTPGADKELEKLFEKARTFEDKIDAAKKKGFSKAQEERFMKILSNVEK